MALKIGNRIGCRSTTTGTGTYAIGSVLDGSFFPLSDIADGEAVRYLVTRGQECEIGEGTVGASGTTLTRDTIKRSTNADAAVNWGSGTKEIRVIADAEILQDLIDNATALSDLAEFVRDTMGTALAGGDGITATVDDVGDTITFSVTPLTTDRVVITDGSGNLGVSSVTATQLGYLSTATSDIQTQINNLSAGVVYKKAVINRVDNTAAPPTEVSGDRYLLDDTGASHANWDGAAANDVVTFNGATWDAETPSEGWRLYNDTTDSDWRFVDDGSPSWEEVTTGSTSFNSLIDVTISSPSNGDLAIYNGTAWTNQPQSALSVTASQVSDFNEALDDRVNALLVEGSNITITYDDGAGTLTIDAGSVVGQLNDLTDVTLTSLTDGEVLVSSSGTFINQTLAEAGIAAATHATQHQSGGSDAIKLDDLAAPDDNTDLNASVTAHGLCPKLSNNSNQYLNGTGAFSSPSSGSSSVHVETDGATVTFNRANGRWQRVTLGGNRTLAFSGFANGDMMLVSLRQDATGSRTVTWPTVRWAGGSPPTLTTTANKEDHFWIGYDGTEYFGAVMEENF